MNKISFSLFALVLSLTGFGQGAYILPSPTAADELVTLYIDVNQSTQNGLKAMLQAHPEEVDNVYLWTWMPNEVPGSNGSWGESAPGRKMTHVSGLLFKMEFIPTQFYQVSGPEFFTKGIACLAKLKDGNAYADMNVGEAKTEDFKIAIVPKLCDDLYCEFPEFAKQDDFVSITYNNNLETNPNLQNLNEGEVYLYILGRGQTAFANYPHVPLAQVTSTPALMMKAVPGKPGEFRLTIYPDTFFPTMPAGTVLNELRYYVVKPGYSPSPPVLDIYTFLDCEN